MFYFEYNLKSQVHHPHLSSSQKSILSKRNAALKQTINHFSVNRYVYTAVTLYVNPSATAAKIVMDRLSY